MLNAASCQLLVNPDGLSVSLFLSCLDDLLALHDFLVDPYLCDSAPIAPPGHLHRSLDASGLADCSFLLYCVSPRTSPCLCRSPLVALPAVGWLFSVLFIISSLLDDERCSASASSLRCSCRCPRTRVASFSSFHHKLVGYGSVLDFHHLLLGCDSFCTFLSPLASWQWLCL